MKLNLIILSLFFTTFLAQGENVIGLIKSIDREARLLNLDVKGSINRYKIGLGDASYLKESSFIRANSIMSDGDWMLERVWPNNRIDEKILKDSNRTLRRETERMGRKAFRSFKDPMPTFAFYSHRGELIRSSMLQGKITLLNFIFTRCRIPNMCPAATERITKLLAMTKDSGIKNVQVFSITLDPDYDTPGILNEYAKSKGIEDNNFHFLTGPTKAVEDMQKHHGIETKDDETFGIYHTMMTVVIDPKKNVYYQVPGSFWSADDYLSRIKKLADEI
tara:strand:- start:65 stop:895 length:831 start_codon:yes stop_codon:yes gene_type:complete